MVESWQPCIGPKGLSFTNESGYLDHVFNNIFSGQYLMFKIHTRWCPQVISWFTIPLTIDISTISPSY